MTSSSSLAADAEADNYGKTFPVPFRFGNNKKKESQSKRHNKTAAISISFNRAISLKYRFDFLQQR